MEVPLSEKSEKVLNLSSRCLFAEHEMPYVHRSFVFTATGIILVATTSLIGYVLYRRRRSLSSARARVDRDLSTIFADRDQSEMEKSKVSRSGMHGPKRQETQSPSVILTGT